MDRTIQNASDVEVQDGIIVLGVASLETQGPTEGGSEEMGLRPGAPISEE